MKNVKVETNVGGGYGVIVTIAGGKPGKTIGLRADYDVLFPIFEETDIPFKSKNPGVIVGVVMMDVARLSAGAC